VNAPAYRCGVVIAAHDEEDAIGGCLDALQMGLPPDFARVVVACNGCRDRTADIARRHAAADWTVLELPEPGKARAIRAAEGLLPPTHRFYFDADIACAGRDLVRLVEVLDAGRLHLVSPAIRFRLDGCGPLARSLNRTWLSLPHGRTGAFHHVLGVSAAGRRRWEEFPLLMGDDAFITSRFRPEERAIVADATVWTRPPRSLRSWMRVRERWLRGRLEMEARGWTAAPDPGQGATLLRMALDPRTAPAAWLYAGVRALAAARVRLGLDGKGWYRDDTSRHPEASGS